MKKFQTKNKISNLAKLLLCTVFISLISCGELFPSDENFIVKKSESYGSKTKYLIEGIKGRNHFYIKTETLYRVGDTLRLTK